MEQAVGGAHGAFFITGDEAADELLRTHPLALLIGMLLDQQVPMEWAFSAPHRLAQRLGRDLDAEAIAAMDRDEFVSLFCEKPALHRYPGSMGKRLHDLCSYLVEHHDGRASDVWTGAHDGAELLARVRALPGFGDEKSRIFVALLAKRFGVRLPGWEEAAAPFSDATARSIADIDPPETLAQVREWKRARKAAGKTKADA